MSQSTVRRGTSGAPSSRCRPPSCVTGSVSASNAARARASSALLCTSVQQRLAPRQAVARHAHCAVLPAKQLRCEHRHQRRGVVQEDAVQAHGAHVVCLVKLANGPAVRAEAACIVPPSQLRTFTFAMQARTTGVSQRVQLRTTHDALLRCVQAHDARHAVWKHAKCLVCRLGIMPAAPAAGQRLRKSKGASENNMLRARCLLLPPGSRCPCS